MASFLDNLNTPHEETDDDFDTDSYNCNENLLIIQNQMYEVRRASLLVSDAESIRDDTLQQQNSSSSSSATSTRTSSTWEADLIEEVRSYECLWNTCCRGYKETPKKNEAWRQISGKINIEGTVTIFYTVYIHFLL